MEATVDRLSHPSRAEVRFPEGVFDALGISSRRRIAIFVICLVVSLAIPLLFPAARELDPAARRAFFILLFAASLWVTEAVPAFAVGFLVIALQIALLGKPGGVFAETSKDWEQFVTVIGHPLVWLFFGGFVLAAGMARTGLDRRLAAALLGRLGDSPSAVLLGVMGITFSLSMFMSNTATTAMILAMLAPLLATLPEEDRFSAGLLLGIAVAANLGGMGSLIGTPPNAIAVGALDDLGPGQQINFLQWMMVGLPPALALLAGSWLLIVRLYCRGAPRIHLPGLESGSAEAETSPAPPWERLTVALTLFATVGLWLTSQWHGLPTAVVSFLPIVALTTTGILGAHDIRTLNYDVLFLIAGGLALGQMVTDTGLSAWIVESIPVEGLGVIAIALLMAYVTVVLSNFMSNTAAANILIPLGVTMAAGFEPAIAVPIALAASSAMCLPIATPPNALAFATGRCRTRDFIRMGLIVGAVAPAVAVLWTWIALDWILGAS